MKSLVNTKQTRSSTLHVYINTKAFTDESRKFVEQKFKKYRNQGTLLCDNFHDNIWQITNEITTINLNFTLNEVAYKASGLRVSFHDFNYYLRAYIILSLGKYAITTLNKTLNILIQVLNITDYFQYPENLYFSEHAGILKELCTTQRYYDFMTMFPIPECEYIAEIIQSNSSFYSSQSDIKQRNLCEFQSYYLFERLIEKFWDDTATTAVERLYYYPIYLFWKLTAILPLRVQEFCLLPQDCISKESSGWFITVRRSNIKGFNKDITYTVDGDYRLYKYAISEELASLFLEYKQLSKDHERSSFNFFSNKLQYEIKPYTTYHPIKNVYSRDSLYLLFDHFYRLIISERYGMNVLSKAEYQQRLNKGIVTEDDFLKTTEILRICAGDLRHISLINLIANGCNILTVHEFTGHDDISSACHYYSNVKNLIKSSAYMIFLEVCQEDVSNAYQHYSNKKFLFKDKPFRQTDYGRCYSPSFIADNIDDCIIVNLQCSICEYSSKESFSQEEAKKEIELLEKEHQLQLQFLEAALLLKDSSGKREQLSIILKQLQAQSIGLKKWYAKNYIQEGK